MSWQWRFWDLFVDISMWPHFPRSLQTFLEMKITLNYRRIFFLLLGLGTVLYLMPMTFRKLRGGGRTKFFSSTEHQLCLQEKLEEFKESIHNFDASLHHDEVESSYFPFTGNGYFVLGVSEVPSSKLILKQGRSFETIPYFPLVSVEVKNNKGILEDKSTTIMDFKNGVVHLIQSFGEGASSRCFQIKRRILAHRRIANLLVETIELFNDSPVDVEVKIGLQTEFKENWQVVVQEGTGKDNEIVAGIVFSKSSPSQKTVVAISRPKLAESKKIVLQTGGTWTKHVYSVISYYSLADGGDVSQTKESLIEEVQDVYQSLQTQKAETLIQGHSLVWNSLWKSGFAISLSKAALAMNGDQINATIYYCLSFERSLNQEIAPTANQLQLKDLAEAPENPGHCYNGHNTMQASKLWSDFRSVEEIIRVTNLWRLTLLKQDCGRFLALGANGFIQAFIMSLGGFQFSNYDHLEMFTHPKELHRNYDFRRIAYGKDTHLNISVRVGEETENKPVLLVSVDRSDKTFYACDAGCLDPPVPLTKEMQEFPIKLTDPITAILYITSDKQHMEELKHTLHLKNIRESDPHPHHVLAEHVHGHSLGGLPPLFWITIALLVALFHMFLIRIVINEYFNQEKTTYVAPRRPLRYTA